MCWITLCGDGKGKVHPITGHKGPEVEYGYTLSLTSALYGGGWSPHPGHFTPRGRPSTHCIGGWVGPTAGLDGCGQSHPTRIWSLDRPACSESIYRLSYPGPPHYVDVIVTLNWVNHVLHFFPTLFHHLHAIFKLSSKCGRCNIRMILGLGRRVEKLDIDSELPVCCVWKPSKQLLLHMCYKKH
jgi:hypothetical protein